MWKQINHRYHYCIINVDLEEDAVRYYVDGKEVSPWIYQHILYGPGEILFNAYMLLRSWWQRKADGTMQFDGVISPP